MTPNVALHKAALLQKRAELRTPDRADLSVVRLADALDQSVADQARMMSENLNSAAVVQCRAIDAALDRIKASVYGECLECGEPISERRLDAIPEAELCARCKQLQEAV